LKITQHYLKSKQTVISTKLFNQSKKMIIRESLNEIDRLKQTNAIIPNIIHSLDATHLMNLMLMNLMLMNLMGETIMVKKRITIKTEQSIKFINT
jgi:DNA-directed RNA polymerase